MNLYAQAQANWPGSRLYPIWKEVARTVARSPVVHPLADKMRVLVADGHTRVRWALRTAIQEEPGVDIVGEVSEGHSLLAQIQALRPDVILLEWELVGRPASEVLTALRALDLRCRVIVLGQQADARAAALDAGADAFVSKADPPETLLRTLRGLVKG
jgi:two-component system invasion response regulator UvrY